MEKTCIICNRIKPLFDFYTHPKMKDGYLNKCKECTKMHSIKRYNIKKNDSDWIELERKRGRKKYHKYKYKSKSKNHYISTLKHRKKYPEKYKAKLKTEKMISIRGHLHHWSYNENHYKDVIDISLKNHAKIHRFLIYDQERKMYRKLNNELLDTKERHLKYINYCIKNEED